MYPIKQSTALTIPFFVHDASGDAATGLTDGSFTKRISKNGAAFGAMTVTISEMENGWYSIPLSTSHSDTTGLLSITFTNAGAKQVNLQFRVSANLHDDLATSTALATAQTDLDTITGSDGVTLATTQSLYAPAKAGDSMALTAGAVDAILDETLTAHVTADSLGVAIKDILADTNELQADDYPTTLATLATAAALATVDTNVDAILADTGTDGVLVATGGISAAALATDAAQEIADTIFTRQMTEAYAADGVAPTLAQMQYMLWSALAEFSIATTTITCKKLDGSTTSMTFTLDDATNPTSRTRAT